jgi:hypothetical protein
MSRAPSLAADDLDQLADRIALAAATVDAAIHRLLTDVRAFDAAEGWAKQGTLSCAHWLNWKCGIALGAAREKVRVARALAAFPLIDEALRLGQVSYSKVRAMTRVASPENEATLLELARHSTASQLEKMCRLVEQARPRAPGEGEPARWVRSRATADGMVTVEAHLRPEEAARVLQACDAAPGSRADGLMHLAEAALRGDRPDRPPVEVTVHVDAATLTGRAGDAGVSAETSRRLLCDSGIVASVEDGRGRTLDLGRKTRVFSGALRRALLARDGGCRFPGCTNRRFVDGHHIRHWVDGGETSLENGLLLCTRHHALVHEGGFGVVRDGDEVHFLSPAGQRLDGRGIPRAVPPPAVVHECPLTWDGNAFDYSAAVESLVAASA